MEGWKDVGLQPSVKKGIETVLPGTVREKERGKWGGVCWGKWGGVCCVWSEKRKGREEAEQKGESKAKQAAFGHDASAEEIETKGGGTETKAERDQQIVPIKKGTSMRPSRGQDLWRWKRTARKLR